MQMKLISLIIDNFKGIKHFAINADGSNVHIQGKNGTGKTTVYDAFLWLLFGKNSLGESKFTIRPTNAPNEIEPCVSASFIIDGKPLELKKTNVSKFNKDTGEFKESVTECFINGVPKKIREYEKTISEMIDEHIFKLLTNSRHFNEGMEWKERRKILFEVCGTLSETDICNSNEAFDCLIEKLEQYGSADEYKKALTADKKNISKEINDIPSRIDEVYKQIDNSVDITAEQAKLATLNTEQGKLITEYNNVKNGTSDAITKQVQELETKLYELEKANRNHIEEQTKNLNADNATYNAKCLDLKSIINNSSADMEILNNRIATLNKTLLQARAEYKNLNIEQWQGDENCPTCKQKLPTEEVEKAKEQFNSNKSKRLEELKIFAERFKVDIATATSELAKATRLNGDTHKELQHLENSKPISNDIPFNLPNFDEGKLKIQEEINRLNAEKLKENSNIAEKLAEISTKGNEVKSQIAETNSRIARAEMNENLQKRINELRAEQKTLQAKQSENLKMLDVLDNFIKAKVDTIEQSINEKFKIAKFKLFEQNKTNDGVTECCEVICNNANRYNDINNAGKTIVGIDILQTLANHYGKNVPLFIDNVDSLDSDNIQKIVDGVEQQVITLKVSDDTKLIIKE